MNTAHRVLHHETLYRGVGSEHTTVELAGAPSVRSDSAALMKGETPTGAVVMCA